MQRRLHSRGVQGLCLHQGPGMGTDHIPSRKLHWVLTRGEYRLLRWFECFADRPESEWEGRRYIEFGEGVGAAGIVAALNGAYVTMESSIQQGATILKNVAVNLPTTYRHRVRICQIDRHSGKSLRENLEQLALCESGERGMQPPKYDFVVTSLTQLDDDILKRMRRFCILAHLLYRGRVCEYICTQRVSVFRKG